MKGISGGKLNITARNVFLGVDLDGEKIHARTDKSQMKHAAGCNV